tara:strand:+ start:122 stop:370 length:249 start_codon:yes stop_codon:yes gene_type:complete
MNITLLKTAGANATGSGAASNFGFAQSVYVVARGANDIVTSSTGGSIHLHSNQAIVINKDRAETLYAGANTTFFTPIGYPRG